MKTSSILVAAILSAALSLSASAHDSKQTVDVQTTDTTTASHDGEHHSFISRVVRFPYNVGRTAFRAPLIIGESVMGQRKIISRHGFFAADEDARHDLTLRRVAFAGDVPDND